MDMPADRGKRAPVKAFAKAGIIIDPLAIGAFNVSYATKSTTLHRTDHSDSSVSVPWYLLTTSDSANTHLSANLHLPGLNHHFFSRCFFTFCVSTALASDEIVFSPFTMNPSASSPTKGPC